MGVLGELGLGVRMGVTHVVGAHDWKKGKSWINMRLGRGGGEKEKKRKGVAAHRIARPKKKVIKILEKTTENRKCECEKAARHTGQRWRRSSTTPPK
jgi:hypothetical protein